MFHFILTYLLYSLICLSKCHAIDKTISKLIIDVTSSFSITAFLCNKPDVNVKFSKELSRNEIIHKIVNSFGEIDFLNLKFKTSNQHFFILNLECPNANKLLLQMNEHEMFVAPNKWLLLKDLRNKSSSNKNIIFDKLNIFPDSEVLFSERLSDNYYEILSVYRPHQHQDLIIESIGNWSLESGLNINNFIPSSRRRLNLRGTHLKTCLVMTDQDTLNHLTDYKYKQVDGVTKANYIWLMHLLNRMNATVNITWRNTWGYQDKNGTWSGMIGLLDSGEIDLGGTATFLISSRIGVVDYVQLYTPVGSRFVFRRPPLSYVQNLFTLPFNSSVWIAIGVFLSIVFVLLHLTMRWEWRNFGENSKVDPTVSENLLILVGAISQQGSDYEPRIISARIVILMLLTAAFSLYASYTANIVALLQSTATSINSIEDLMNSGLKFGIMDVVYNRYYFPASEEPIRKQFYERFVANKTSVWMSLEDGIQKLREGFFAFHFDQTAGYQLMQETYEEDEKCGLHEIDYLNLLQPMLVIKRQSPFREIVRVGALWIHETGLKKHDTAKLFPRKPTCVGHTSFVNVGFIECYAAIYTFIYGVAAALSIFFLEIIWHKCFKNDVMNEEMGETPLTDVESPDEKISQDLKSLESD